MRGPVLSRSVLPTKHTIASRCAPKRWSNPAGAGGPAITIEQCVQPFLSVTFTSLRTVSFSQRAKRLQAFGLGRECATLGAPPRLLAGSPKGRKVPFGSKYNLRVAAVDRKNEGDKYDGRASGTDSLLDALKDAEMRFTGRGGRLPPLTDADGSNPDDQVETDSGTGILLEALRALEHNSRPKGSNSAGVGLGSPSAPSSQGAQPSSPSSVGPSNQSKSRAMVEVGSLVDVVVKKDQANGRLTRGVVAKILTNSSDHPRGIKVRLRGEEVGRIHDIVSPPSSSTFLKDDEDLRESSRESVAGDGNDDEKGESTSGRTAEDSKGDKKQGETSVRGTKIFLTGLSREATTEDLREALRGVEGVRNAFVVLNKQKQCQGYGFVQLDGDVEAGLAKMNEIEVRGRKLIAAVSIEKKQKESGEAPAGKVADGGGSRAARESEGPRRKRSANGQSSDDGARLLLDAFQGMQEKRAARPGRARKRGGHGGSRFRTGEDEDSDDNEELVSSLGGDEAQSSEDDTNESGEPRVITISDDGAKTADANQPSMGQLVMAAMERAREQKGIEKTPAAVASTKGVGDFKNVDVSLDDEVNEVPLKPLRIYPDWTAKIEALSRRLEEVKRLPIEIRS